MGKVILTKNIVTIGNGIEFVLNCFEAAKIDAGFVENNPIDARLQPSKTSIKRGGVNKIKSTISSVTEAHYGHEYVELPDISINLIQKTENIYNFYNDDWINHIEKVKRSSILPLGKLGAEEVTNKSIHSAHILIHHLAIRIFAFTLSEEEKLNIDVRQYHTLLKSFGEKLLSSDKKCPLFKSENHLDAIGIFLGCSHKQWVETLDAILESRILKNSHKSALQSAENILANIQKITIRQLIAFLNPETTKAEMADGYYKKTFEAIEGKVVEKAIEKDKQKEDLLLEEKTIYQRKDIVLTSLREEKHKWLANVELLYNLLEEVQTCRNLLACVQSFIDDTGWMAILNGCVFFDNLNADLQQFIASASKSLFVPENSPIIETKAGTALIARNSTNLCDVIEEGFELSKNFKALQNPDVLNWIRKEITTNLQALGRMQARRGVTFVDLSKCQFDWLQQTNTQTCTSTSTSVGNSTPPVPPKLNRPRPVTCSFTTPDVSSSEGHKKKGTVRKVADKFSQNVSKRNPYSSSSKKSGSFSEEKVSTASDASEANTAWSGEGDIPLQEFVSPSYKGKDKGNESLFFEEASFENSVVDHSKVWDLASTALKKKDVHTLGTILSNNGKFRDTFDKRTVYCKGPVLPLINIQDEDKNTLLHHAVMKNDKERIEWLLYYGASVFVRNKDDLIPLELVAQSENERSIFLSLIEQAKVEARPHQQGIEDFNTLCQLSFELSGFLYLKLCEYNELIKEREASGFHQHVTVPFAKFFDKEFTPQRNKAQAMAYRALVNAEEKRDYKQFLNNLMDIQDLGNQEGKLHPMIAEVIKKSSDILANKEINKAYHAELSEWKTSKESSHSPSFFKDQPSGSTFVRVNQSSFKSDSSNVKQGRSFK